MALTDDQIKEILLNALDGFKDRVRQQTFSDKVVEGVAMTSMPIKPARPGSPAGVLMLAISEKHYSIDQVAESFDYWGSRPSS